MQSLALLLAIPVSLTFSQAPAPEKAAGDLSSNELVAALLMEMSGIRPAQAQAAAGTLFSVAKTKLPVADFAKVASAVPNMDGFLKAVPGGEAKDGAKASGPAGAMATASALSKLGLKPDQIAKMAPALVKFVQSKGGPEVAGLLASALK